MWSNAAPTRHINCGLPPEFFLVAPASSFQQYHPVEGNAAAINFDPHASSTIGVGVIPLLTAAPCLATPPSIGADDDLLNNARIRGGGMQLWQHQHQQEQNSAAYLKKPTIADQTNLVTNSVAGGEIGAATCHDCGNQAKKDCSHQRCRTCCKSRGYDCATHVKSTWVSASRRRERQLIAATAGSSQSTSGAKKPKLGGQSQTTTTASHTSTSNTTPPRSFDTISSHQDVGFKDSLPCQVRAPAVFKCVKVTALDDGDDEYAYQAAVRIGGHVFKGFLYDQGFDGREGFPNMSELHLGGGGRNGGASSTPVIDPAELYNTTSAGGLLGGSSNYGNPMN